jgi:hypothetical protein
LIAHASDYDAANGMSEDEFEEFGRELLEDNDPGEIEAIAACMSPLPQALLPRRTLH